MTRRYFFGGVMLVAMVASGNPAAHSQPLHREPTPLSPAQIDEHRVFHSVPPMPSVRCIQEHQRVRSTAELDMMHHVYLRGRSCSDQSAVCRFGRDGTWHCSQWTVLPGTPRLVFARCRPVREGDRELDDRCVPDTAEGFGADSPL